MQGRLSPIVDGRIQAFPWGNWQREFQAGKKIGFDSIEWTIDSKNYALNPIFSSVQEIRELIGNTGVKVSSLTNDYFMENPPWVVGRPFVKDALVKLIHAMSQIGAELLVIPLVDNSSIKGDKAKENSIVELFLDLCFELKRNRVKICFEVDLPPQSTSNFIEVFPSELFGINYDIGNSASLGYDPVTELSLYGHRVMNVHVKDRVYGGSTIKLGEGCADFLRIFELLEKLNYSYNYILQTARATDDDHESTLVYSKIFVEKFLGRNK